jgi:ABC-2 type transport system ATP-binding protein
MAIITLRDLRKTFYVKRKAAGLRGSFASLWRPNRETIEAVKGISLEMKEGEMLAFIGPNGAGKSTTIKMLTGILHPTDGEAEVLGLIPWKQRRDLAYNIGSVFGQKPQLWYHLPPIDTFDLFAHIYELDQACYRRRRDFLVEAFEIGDLLDIPVRKLSLGQRMRCEIAASLLHEPKIVFLDEPTIGLDVVAKQQLRDTIKRLHAEDQTTIFLTSHDAGDIESLCERVIVINHGQVIFDDAVKVLKRRYLRRKVIEVRFGKALNGHEDSIATIDGIRVLKLGRYGAKLELDTQIRPVDAVLQDLMAAHSVADLNVMDPAMEEIIRDIYQRQDAVAVPDTMEEGG